MSQSPSPLKHLPSLGSRRESDTGANPLPGRAVLVCEHRDSDHGTLDAVASRLTERGWVVQRTRSLQQSLEVLRQCPQALVLLDPLLEGGEVEIEALERCRPGECHTPLLLVRPARDPRGGLEALRAQSGLLWDMIDSAASADEFVLRAERLLRLANEMADLAQWRHRAVHDDRTHLLRPRAFEERLFEHFSAAQRHGFAMGLVLLDLDHFGAVNKLHDHTVGDHLIEHVGATIRRSLRTEDVAGRLGGDEFAVLLPYTGGPEAYTVVERLRGEIRKLSEVPLCRSGSLRVSASLGYDIWSPPAEGHLAPRVAAMSAVELRRNAERALRAAKRSGGDLALSFEASQRGEALAPAEN